MVDSPQTTVHSKSGKQAFIDGHLLLVYSPRPWTVDRGPWTISAYLAENLDRKKLKSTPLLLTIAVLVLLAGGYYLYENVLNKEPLRPWELVPSETVFVYEKDACQSCIEDMQKNPVWEILSRAAFYTEPTDSLRGKLNGIISRGAGLLVSAHITRKDDFDFVYYLSGIQNLQEDLLRFTQLKNYRYSERELNEVKIHELTMNKQTFSWVVIRDVWVGSFTPFLIEDVIRTYNGKPNFNRANPEVRKLPRISGDAGNLYVQLKSFSEWFSVFVPGSEKIYPLGRSSLLDIKSFEDNLVLNGFSLDTAAYSEYFLSLFRKQSPVAFGLKNHVPNRAILFSSYGINDGAAFNTSLEGFVRAHKPQLRDSLNKLSAGLKFDWKDLYGTVSNEIGVCVLEGIESQRLTKILMIETKAPDLWIKHLDAVAEKFSEDTVFNERFSDFVIREIPVHRFPEKLLWPLVQGFDHTFYASSGNVIFMGDNLEEFKNFLEDIEHEDIWGKSVSKNQFLESTLLESNVSLFVNTPKVWNVLTPKLSPRWRQFVREHISLLQSLQMSAFQFSHLNNTYYTNIAINSTKDKPEVAFASTSRRNVVHFSQAIHRIHAVRSHVSRANEILIQDSLNDISLVSMEGKELWKIPVGDQIASEVHQVDYFRNGKLQYIFATHDAIHIIDRLGNYVAPFPVHLAGRDIRHLSVVDYDRSKNYRFLVAENDGKVWMYDKSGNNLEGWNPRDVGGPLLAPPMHHRIKGRDFILAIRKDGIVHLYNRRGEMEKNFPLDLKATPMGDYFLDMGSTIASTSFVVVTRDGFRIRFSPEGKIQNRETLLRTAVGSQFGMKAENSDKSYLVWQHDNRQLTLTDAAGKKVLANDYISLKNWDIKYYHYGGGKSFISVTDKTQELSYVFDGAGNLMTNPPLESTAIELRMAGSDQSYVFFIHGKTLTIQPLNP